MHGERAYPLRVAVPIDERQYAWRMLRAARRAHASGGAPVSETARDELAALLEQAMEAGLDRAELIIALSQLGGRLLMLCNPAEVSSDADVTAEAEDVCLT